MLRGSFQAIRCKGKEGFVGSFCEILEDVWARVCLRGVFAEVKVYGEESRQNKIEKFFLAKRLRKFVTTFKKFSVYKRGFEELRDFYKRERLQEIQENLSSKYSLTRSLNSARNQLNLINTEFSSNLDYNLLLQCNPLISKTSTNTQSSAKEGSKFFFVPKNYSTAAKDLTTANTTF